MGAFDPSALGVEELRGLVDRLSTENGQLTQALESRIAIEQAKGVLAERYRLSVEDAFLLLRTSARGARVRIHDLAREVVRAPETPAPVVRGMARDSRLRAAAMRERTEATAEKTGELRSTYAEQVDRLAHWTNRPTARVRVVSRSDAVDLAARLSGYRWYLIVPDDEHWEVVVEFSGDATELPQDLRDRLDEWLQARAVTSARVRLADAEFELAAS
jgi:ANTAR domain-containing protein